MDRAEWEAELNHTGELHDIEPPEEPQEDRETMRRDWERGIYDQCDAEDRVSEEPDAATAYVQAVFDGYARRQAALRASRDMEAIRRSNENTQTLLKALGWPTEAA